MRRFHVNALLLSLMLGAVCLMAPGLLAQETEGDETGYLLRWDPAVGSRYTYMLSISGTRGESIAVRTEDFTIEVVEASDGVIHFLARGEPVSEGARLGYRFQRALWPEFPYTVDSLGNTESASGQPFPPFLNVPILPEDAVAEGASWSGGPVAVLPHANVGAVPFTFESTLGSVAVFRGEECAVIETIYSVALPEDAVSLAPFLGLVEGDPPEEPGHGAPIGGVVEGSRAHEAGVEPGDFIIEAEGQRIRGWGGLEEILPHLVPEVPVEFIVRRGEEEIEMEIVPEGVPIASISAAGGLHSTCFFSVVRGIPLKIDLTSQDLVFVLANPEGETEEREMDLHIVLEYQYGGG